MHESINFGNVIHLAVAVIAIVLFVSLNALALVLMERKVAGFVQRRPGPVEVGPWGLLQVFCDAVKLVGKQVLIPEKSDKFLYALAPIVTFMPVLLLFMPIPFSPFLTGWEVNLGVLLILAFAGFSLLSTLLAGWSSNNKYSLYGAARGVAQTVAYEIPLLLAVLAIVLQHGTLNMSTLVEQQGRWPWQWNIFTQPFAFIIFLLSIFAETNRAPFDLAESESELTGGYHTEYSGMGFGMFFLAEYANMVLVCSVGTALFLGGWKGPVFEGVFWFLLKTYALVFLMLWVRWTYPRVRFDQILNLNWKWLLPIGVANLLVTAFLVKL